MTERAFNFSAGPAMLPLPVLQRVREELLDYQGLGASIIEISHFSEAFTSLMHETEQLLVELLEVPSNYRIAFAHGGATMQFSMVPLNLIARKPARKALYVETGHFSKSAIAEAGRYGTIEAPLSTREDDFRSIPSLEEVETAARDSGASYLHITTNNTMKGTRWSEFPSLGELPLVGDATSEILSRPIDISRFGVLYAGAQKNMGPSGVSVAIVREDLLGHALPLTPKMLNYTQLARDHSLTNTANTFAIYVINLVLHWVKTSGGVKEMERQNEEKAGLIYAALDRHAGFYTPHSRPECRSTMNVVFRLQDEALDERFAREANAEGLYATRGHRLMGGIRASIYNGMPSEGASSLAGFIDEFARRNG